MPRRTSLVTTTALLAGSLLLAACGNGDSSTGAGGHDMSSMSGSSTSSGSAPGSGSAPADAGRQGDVMFAQMMIPHHRQAIEMADIALQKPSSSAPVKKLATDIRKAQGPEITTMTGWLQSWGAPTSMPSGHDMSGMMSSAEMDGLKKAEGPAFDRQWLTLMIKHHRGAVQMAQGVNKTTNNPDVRTMANGIITSQNAEIRTMEGLLKK